MRVNVACRLKEVLQSGECNSLQRLLLFGYVWRPDYPRGKASAQQEIPCFLQLHKYFFQARPVMNSKQRI